MRVEKLWQRFSEAQKTDRMNDNSETYTLGENSGELLLDSAKLIQEHIIAMAGQAMRKLILFSPVLSHRLYDSEQLVDAVSGAVRAYHKLQVRIIICNPQPCVSRHHRLVALAQQLSSYIEIRRAHEDYRSATHDYLIADDRAYIRRPHFERYTGEANYNNPLRAQTDSDQIMNVWEQSEREVEFLSLHL